MNPYIYSLQVGKVKKLTDWETGSFKNKVHTIEVLYHGIEGDEVSDTLHHGGLEKAVFANSIQNYPQWQNFLGVDILETGGLSENMTLSGLHETTVYLGDIHTIGEVVLQVVQPRKPCWKISKRHNNKNFTRHIYETGHTGWYYRVLKPGRITQYDTIAVSPAEEKEISIMEANCAFQNPKEYKAILEDILTLDTISISYKESIVKRLSGEYSLAFMEQQE